MDNRNFSSGGDLRGEKGEFTNYAPPTSQKGLLGGYTFRKNKYQLLSEILRKFNGPERCILTLNKEKLL